MATASLPCTHIDSSEFWSLVSSLISCHVEPPSRVTSRVPRWPTAIPFSASENATAVSVVKTGDSATFHALPSSSVYRMRPRSPTATRRLPALAEPSSSSLFGSTRDSGTKAADCGSAAPCAANIGIATARPIAASDAARTGKQETSIKVLLRSHAPQLIRLKVGQLALDAEDPGFRDIERGLIDDIAARGQVVNGEQRIPGHRDIVVLNRRAVLIAPQIAAAVIEILHHDLPGVLIDEQGTLRRDVPRARLQRSLDRPDAMQL